MPLNDARLIAMKNGVVELTATVSHPERDTPESFSEAVQQLLFDHQYQVMTDATILDGDSLQVGTVIEARDPLPEELHDALASLGFSALEGETAGGTSPSLFSRFQKRARSKLDRWRAIYRRAADVSPRLADLEEALIEEVPDGDWTEIAAEASDALIRAAHTYLRIDIHPNRSGLEALERHLIEERGERRGRLVFHPALVRGLAGFITSTFVEEAPGTMWSAEGDDESPLWVRGHRGPPVGTDPEFRVIQFVVRGRRASLRQYVQSVLTQAGLL